MKTADISPELRTVFLVDDDSSTVSLYSTRLEQAGFKTASAFDTKEAFEVLPNLSADLIILNLMLPNRGGFEFLEAVRSDSRHKDTPVLVLSNAYLPELLYRRRTIDTSRPFAELRAMSRINDRARAAGEGEDFSARIRAGLPMPPLETRAV